MTRIGWQVHGWAYPIVWWARRKPSSSLRQKLWDCADRVEWRRTCRALRRIRDERDAHYAAVSEGENE